MQVCSLRVLVFIVTITSDGAAHSAARPGDEPSDARSDQPHNFTVARDSPIMRRAIAHAREGFPGFFDLAERPRNGMHTFAVKYRLTTPHGAEYVWGSFHKRMGNRVLVTVDVDVRWSKDVHAGDPMFVEGGDIVDWLYMDGGRMMGNVTLCALDAMSPSSDRQALRKEVQLDCTWLKTDKH